MALPCIELNYRLYASFGLEQAHAALSVPVSSFCCCRRAAGYVSLVHAFSARREQGLMHLEIPAACPADAAVGVEVEPSARCVHAMCGSGGMDTVAQHTWGAPCCNCRDPIQSSVCDSPVAMKRKGLCRRSDLRWSVHVLAVYSIAVALLQMSRDRCTVAFEHACAKQVLVQLLRWQIQREPSATSPWGIFEKV